METSLQCQLFTVSKDEPRYSPCFKNVKRSNAATVAPPFFPPLFQCVNRKWWPPLFIAPEPVTVHHQQIRLCLHMCSCLVQTYAQQLHTFLDTLFNKVTQFVQSDFFCRDSICIDVTIQQILATSNCPLVRLHGRFMYIKQCIKVNLQKQRAIIANVIFFLPLWDSNFKSIKEDSCSCCDMR